MIVQRRALCRVYVHRAAMAMSAIVTPSPNGEKMPAELIGCVRASLRRTGVRRIFATACVLAFSAASATAQISDAPEAVVITARPPDPVGNAAFSTVLIDTGQLHTTPELDAALREVPGLSYFKDFSTLAAFPARIGVSVRNLIAGSGVARALVTLDGVPQNDPFGDWVIPSSLPAEDLSSVEIVRGAGAGPYGSGALTGVIELSESDALGVFADAEAGNLEQQRYHFVAEQQEGNLRFGASGTYGRSGGWYAVDTAQRGAVDTPVSLEAENLSVHAASEVLEGVLLAVRFGAYEERRGLGLVGTATDAKGVTGSATLVKPETASTLGWRAQLWFRNSDFASNSVIVGPGRATATPSVDGYATPALGWGGNVAMRGTLPWIDWEVGADARLDQGEARELSVWSSGAFQSSRFSGGHALVSGLYTEAAAHFDGLLFTAGLRIDEWNNAGGHTIALSPATDSVLLTNEFAPRSGSIPTARGGIRKDLAGGSYTRVAAYEGFRPPSLNELYRPTPQGMQFIDANPTLEPERLYGAEIGLGGVDGQFSWDITGFWNRLSGAISNVTLGIGPGNFPDVGFLPPRELYIQRQNVGHIEGLGSEG